MWDGYRNTTSWSIFVETFNEVTLAGNEQGQTAFRETLGCKLGMYIH